MAAADAPTTPRGTLGTSSLAYGWGGGIDPIEHVPDLRWPTSVQTYARMRNDPTLASVLAAYSLPIRSARWEIDPRGASPDAVRVCADSLGLPVRGEPDDPGPVRRRGVHWLAHLRAALGMLWAGHAVFEPVYDLSSGRAMLASVAERLQTSLAEIEVDDQGNLKAVTQYGDVTKPNPPAIPADRLLWYAREREGSSWVGQSILRPAFGSWLLKQDSLRVGATALRRFGSGTPTVVWDAGTQPTSAQMAEAQRVAANIRVGDSGGSALPPGARLRIEGVSGTYPDALPYLRYLDEQMARAALTSMLDLGNTSNGSRALGESFAELLALAQQGTAESIAETATELCVRLVDYNFGEDSPAPAVACGVIGDDEQALAQSISALVQAGAVQVDDSLEDWLRQAFRAPARTSPRTQPPAGPPTAAPTPDTTPAPVAARKVTAADATQTTDPTAPTTRELTADEIAAGFDPQEVEDEHAAVLAMLLAAWLLIRRAQRDEIVSEVDAALTAGGVAALAELTVTTTDAATTLGAAMLYGADAGVRLATREAARQGVTITGAAPDTDALETLATTLADVLGRALAASAAQQAIHLAASGMPPADVAAGVAQHLDGLSQTWVEDQLAGAIWTGMGAGRAAVYTAGPPAVFVASEILDRATCRQESGDPVRRCWETDGTRYDTIADALRDYPAGRYRACKGGVRCRGQVVAIFRTEAA